ncbi:MFS transporter [Phycisphaerales bacterium AB-hyl4]|uniref:MFS transporter n=1 Tax=Natronomicrosphaera hydrolytica TaxID=3242702 RepID=A0ABV4U409_9BACT
MRAIKINYFLGYALMGSVLPYLPVYLRAQDLTNTQVGYILGMMGIAILLSPVALTLLADAHLEGKTLLAAVFAASGSALAAMLLVDGFWPIFLVHALFCLAFVSMMPLQDGLNFQVQAQRQSAGRMTVPYHRVRVWGTVGFILPSLILYLALVNGAPIGAILVVGGAFGLIGMLNTTALPHTRSTPRGGGPASDVPLPTNNNQPEANNNKPLANGNNRLPTIDALHAMLRPHVLVFCAAMFLAHIANSAYYAFYPLYLTEQVGVPNEWVGLITNLGVAIEVFFMLGFGLLMARFGIRWLMAIGIIAMALRMLLLYTWPSVAMAVATQLLHGLHVLVIHVAPPIFLNRQADNRYRNSIHGLYAMTVYGVGRIIGAVLGGFIADISLLAVFGYSALVCAAAAVLFALFYREPTAQPEVSR